jgi:predicted metalloprotease with PDZ domain
VGLKLEAEMASQPNLGWTPERRSEGALRLKAVARHGAAESAGLEVGDELLALNRQRLKRVEDLESLFPAPPIAGEPISVLFCRDGVVRDTSLTPEPPAISRWWLQTDPEASSEVHQRRRQWLELVP